MFDLVQGFPFGGARTHWTLGVRDGSIGVAKNFTENIFYM